MSTRMYPRSEVQQFYGTQPDPLPETLPDGTLIIERAGDLQPSGGQLKGARLDSAERGSYYGDGWINGFYFNRAIVSADRIHWPSVPKQPVCGDKHFGADVCCTLEPGHKGAHQKADMYWVHPSDHARCDRTTYEFVVREEIAVLGEGVFYLQEPIPKICRSCTSPAGLRSAYCVYCAHSTEEGRISPVEADRIAAGGMLNEDAHPGIVAARARNEAALVAERPKSTKSSRQAALPNPYEAWITPGWES